MKKVFIVSMISLAGLVSSCKKETTDTPIDTILIDGGEFSYSVSARMYTDTGSYPYVLSIRGFGRTGMYAPSFSLAIKSPTPITTGTFSEIAPAGYPVASMGFWSYAGRNNMGVLYETQHTNSTDPVTITLTAINRTTVEGTFKGSIPAYPGSLASGSMTIKDGKFYVRFKRSLFFTTL
jgi:hypothetical protein